MFFYKVHGLRIASELDCPDFRPTQSGFSDPDVVIRVGNVPDELPDPIFNDKFRQAKPGAYLLKLDDIARFLVTDGKEILVQPAAGCPPEVIHLYLSSHGFGSLLHQRRQLALHASAVLTKKGVVLFMGYSGAGKSTTVATLLKRGYQVLADDLCTIGFSDDQEPRVFPGFAQMRLWDNTIELLGYDRGAMKQVRHKENKYLFNLENHLTDDSMQLRSIYMLNPADTQEISIESLNFREKFESLLKNVHKMEYVKCLGVQENIFRQITKLLENTQIKRITRPKNNSSIQQFIQWLEKDLNSI